MTDQSIVNVKSAKTAVLVPQDGGYTVLLTGKTGRTVTVKDGAGDLLYSSKAAAKKSICAHNPNLAEADLEPEI